RVERVEHSRRRVTENDRAPGQHVVDVLAAIHIPEARAGAATDDERLTAHAAERAHRRADAAGKQRARPFHYFVRARRHRPKLPTVPKTGRRRATRGGATGARTTVTSDARKSTSSTTSSSDTSANVPGSKPAAPETYVTPSM